MGLGSNPCCGMSFFPEMSSRRPRQIEMVEQASATVSPQATIAEETRGAATTGQPRTSNGAGVGNASSMRHRFTSQSRSNESNGAPGSATAASVTVSDAQQAAPVFHSS